MKISIQNLSSRGFGGLFSEPFTAPPVVGRTLPEFLANLTSEWLARARTRRQFQSLCELDDRTLQDIGMSRSQVDFEATRPIWWR
ncbi:MAG: DUF1127 domain-containing protein [Hyphomicrobiales bacterium]|nr:DUF1127 domain-containing protein [Hyphomicrobiales bacterium]